MPFDRAATLKNAEKLLRQGRQDQAIAEYVRLVEDQPRDWNTANLLGDLYVRNGQLEKAIGQFLRIADSLSADGFLSRANAIYKKVLKLDPGHEHALLKAGEIATRQGLAADARSHLTALADRRRRRGDTGGAADAMKRLASLDSVPSEATGPPVVQPGERTRPPDISGFDERRGLVADQPDERREPDEPREPDKRREPDKPDEPTERREPDPPAEPGEPPEPIERREPDRSPSDEPEPQPAEPDERGYERVEVDLSTALDELTNPPVVPEADAATGSVPSLDAVFADLRDQVARRPEHDEALAQYQRALLLIDAGKGEASISALETASRVPSLRFPAASRLARVYRDAGRMQDAIEWFERAAEAPAPSEAEGHMVLYDLAETLEKIGETARALAIWMELQAEAGDYRDAAEHVDRLSKARAGG